MTTLYVLIGLPASGKTTWARRNFKSLHAVIVCSDDIRRDFQADGRDTMDTDLVFVEMEQRARSWLQAGQSVMLDATHFSRTYRRYAVRLASETGAHRVAIWLDLPLSVCLERNARRGEGECGAVDGPFFPPSAHEVRDIAGLFEPPGSDEFDEVVRVGWQVAGS